MFVVQEARNLRGAVWAKVKLSNVSIRKLHSDLAK